MTAFISIADGQRVAVENGLTIGRSADCGLVLQDTKASRHHARLIVEGGVVEIEDLESSNGTLINGKPVDKRMLRHGDVVQIGTTVLTYEEGGPQSVGLERGAAAPADDVDLFGAADEVDLEPAPPAPATRQQPEPSPPPLAAPPPEPPPPPPREVEVVEFEDEVVEVRKAPEPSVARPTVERKQRILQYSEHASGGGVMRDDLAQMPGWQRNLLVLLAVAAAVGLGYLAMVVARG